MKRVTTIYLLRLVFEAPVEIPQEVVEKVIDYSTAREAIEEGVWNWLPVQEGDGDDGESIFDMSLEVNRKVMVTERE